jgi:hypothetical protein
MKKKFDNEIVIIRVQKKREEIEMTTIIIGSKINIHKKKSIRQR